MKFKVGDKVKAVNNNTIFTSERMKWAGVVTKITEDGFSAKTTKHLLLSALDVEFDCLDYNDFELETEEKAKEEPKPQVVSTMPKDNPVSHPSHYADGKIEVIDFIEDKGLNFNRGNAVKYLCRAGKKDPVKEIEDLEKAMWYINHEIERLKGEKK